jgi:digeranylgeranylglycerophospholipid reductase
MYDLIVVGAGPAGATAGKYAASHGCRTLLLDKKKTIGWPVRCSEFLPTVKELKNIFPTVPAIEDLFQIPPRLITHQIRLMRIFTPSSLILEFEFEGLILNRKEYDYFLVKKAEERGVEVKLEVEFLKFSADSSKILTSKGSFCSKVILGADGPNSRVAKNKNFPPIELACCAQFEMEKVKIEPGVIEMYFGSIAPGGYLWIIPMGEQKAKVGLGVRKKFTSTSPLKLLQNALSRFPLQEKLKGGEICSLITGLVPVYGPRKKIVQDNVLLAGDAAGQVMSTNGGGLPLALICGREAGEITASFIKGKTHLEEYEKRIQKKCGQELKNSRKYLKMFDFLSRKNFLLDTGMRILNRKGLKRIITCQPLFDIFSNSKF